MYDPWGELRRLDGWRVEFVSFPGDRWGRADFQSHVISIDQDLTQAQRRSTLAHELVHVERGRPPDRCGGTDREELTVRDVCSRRLIELPQLGDALRWGGDELEMAAELWVSVTTLRFRLDHLTVAEQEWLDSYLDCQSA